MKGFSFESFTICGISILALCVGVSFSGDAQPIRTLESSTSEFLQPISGLSTQDTLVAPGFCFQGREYTCPPTVESFGSGSAGDQLANPVFTANLPHVRVTFNIDEIENIPVSNGGASIAQASSEHSPLIWNTSSSEADIQNGGPYDWFLPEPGEKLLGSPIIYNAVVMNACESLTSFDVVHEATISGVEPFVAGDNTTIDSTGYYNINYVVRATDVEGGVSDFHFSGRANVICSGSSELLPEGHGS